MGAARARQDNTAHVDGLTEHNQSPTQTKTEPMFKHNTNIET